MPSSFRRCRLLLLTAAAAAGIAVSPVHAQSLLPGGNWSGPYWGLDAGAAWTNAKTVRKASDVIWGAHAGYGLNFSGIYLGLEGDGTWGGAEATSELSPSLSARLAVDWTASARARVGLMFGPALAYVTGGAAWSGQTVTIHNLGSSIAREDKILLGTVIGAGVEVTALPNIGIRLEALRYDFSGDASDAFKSLPAGLTSNALKGLSGDEAVVRAGVSLRFN